MKMRMVMVMMRMVMVMMRMMMVMKFDKIFINN